ncbi:MAG TPA: hypothetical protein VGH97_14500 [Thermoanaerobaculia bacterium]
MEARRSTVLGLLLLGAFAAASALEALPSAPDWPAWFAKNTVVTDKKTYVHFFWNANDVKDRFAANGKDRDALLAEAARQLVALQYPKGATADAMRVDVVFVEQRDEYGMPKWDTMKRVAHLEFSKKTQSETAPAASDPRRGFDKFEVFP